MDPVATLRRFFEATEDNDRREALEALDDLHEWIRHGGFLPPADQLRQLCKDWSERPNPG